MRYLILLICIVLVGCRFSNSGHNRFSENWYSCSKDGLYIELIIKADSFKYSANNGMVTKYCNFKFENDTLNKVSFYLFSIKLLYELAVKNIYFIYINE
jgi:hypothetical protein